MRKLFLTLILLAVIGVSHAQIVIDQAVDNWRAKVDSAISLIKTSPSFYYTGLKTFYIKSDTIETIWHLLKK
jgi:hypothetical protein